MFTKRLLAVAVAAATMAVTGGALGNSLTIITTQGSLPEHSGDPSGSIYPWAGGPGPGAGLPWQTRGTDGTTVTGGWPTGPGFSQDTSTIPTRWSMSGWDASYLQLDNPGWVTFQFMGGGDSGLANSFWVDLNGNAAGGWTQLFQDSHGGSPTNPCQVTPNGAKFPSCDMVQASGGPVAADHSFNQYTFYFDAASLVNVNGFTNLIPFAFDTGLVGGANGGLGGPINNPNSDWNWGGLTSAYPGATGNPPDQLPFPGFLLGIDPYLAAGPHQLTGQAVYAGLSDQSRVGGLDHDYQDMGVRISVPEPGSLALLGLALGGLAFGRRRKGANA